MVTPSRWQGSWYTFQGIRFPYTINGLIAGKVAASKPLKRD